MSHSGDAKSKSAFSDKSRQFWLNLFLLEFCKLFGFNSRKMGKVCLWLLWGLSPLTYLHVLEVSDILEEERKISFEEKCSKFKNS